MSEEKEVWKNVVGYEELYQVSNLGRVRSKDKIVTRGSVKQPRKGKLLSIGYGVDRYGKVVLCRNTNRRTRTVHLLVAEAFLNHKSDPSQKKVVNHKNFNRRDSRLINLEIVTARENGNKKHLDSSSKYTGVHWNSQRGKWCSFIHINGKSKNLGSFTDEYEARLAYESALSNLNKAQ
ncbi:MAG: putative uncharacterized HNH endonuclease [Prokaryotic dsDNA virus sp.]|nr:MAG: putative uncharacterized HNH endonuclease [Prokaryotic dsDNA virus sp.]|tara:strand:- start:52184 stop:52717 length:534 start_codon:yes stop_codon:yes gene_type:complete